MKFQCSKVSYGACMSSIAAFGSKGCFANPAAHQLYNDCSRLIDTNAHAGRFIGFELGVSYRQAPRGRMVGGGFLPDISDR